MNRFKGLLENAAVGSSFYVQPAQLGMDDDANGFDQLVDSWVGAGGGDGFTVSDARKESMSGRRLYRIVKVTRTK